MRCRSPITRVAASVLTAASLLAALALAARTQAPEAASRPVPPAPVHVFYASTLAGYMKALAGIYRRRFSGARVLGEASGSLDAIRKVTDLGRSADLVVSADWRLLAKPHHGLDPWVIVFAGNEMALLYTAQSRGARHINTSNWYRILLQPGVRYGHSDPARDPEGYWTLIVWKLAERYYKRPGLAAQLNAHCPPANIRPSDSELVALLQSGELDYYFGFRSEARLGGFRYVELPPEINLGAMKYAKSYSQASVDVGPDAKPIRINGAPVAYGVTLASHPQNRAGALALMRLMLGAAGRHLAEQSGLVAYPRPLALDPAHRLPRELAPLVGALAAP